MGIGTSPEQELNLSFEIPKELLAEFQRDIRIVIKYPIGTLGIIAPDVLLNKDVLGKFRDFDVVLVPREFSR